MTFSAAPQLVNEIYLFGDFYNEPIIFFPPTPHRIQQHFHAYYECHFFFHISVEVRFSSQLTNKLFIKRNFVDREQQANGFVMQQKLISLYSGKKAGNQRVS